jgi:CBS domain-containing protein
MATKRPAKKKPARVQSLDDLTAGDIMHSPIVSVPLTAPLAEVQQVLADNRISGVAVANEAGGIVGVVSSKDLLDRYVEEGEPTQRRRYYETSGDSVEEERHFEREEDAGSLTAADVMTPDVYSVPVTTKLRPLAKRMVDWNVHRVLVSDRKRHVGLISTMDVLTAVATSR